MNEFGFDFLGTRVVVIPRPDEPFYIGSLYKFRVVGSEITQAEILIGTKGLNEENLKAWLIVLLHELGHLYSWKSRGLSYEEIKFINTMRRYNQELKRAEELRAWRFVFQILPEPLTFGMALVCMVSYYHPDPFKLFLDGFFDRAISGILKLFGDG